MRGSAAARGRPAVRAGGPAASLPARRRRDWVEDGAGRMEILPDLMILAEGLLANKEENWRNA